MGWMGLRRWVWFLEPSGRERLTTQRKGRVERAISYVRRAFFLARRFRDVEDLNHQAQAWCDGPACQRRWVEDDRLTVAE